VVPKSDNGLQAIDNHQRSKRNCGSWVKNIRRNSEVVVRIGERQIGATARVLDRETDRELWDQVAAIADRKYGWGDGLPVEITPLTLPKAHSDLTIKPDEGR
jgi:hypothetical protein